MKKANIAIISVILSLCLLVLILFTSCVPACVGIAFVDYPNLGSNLNAPTVDKKLGKALANGYYEAAAEAIEDGANVDKTVITLFIRLGQPNYSTVSECITNSNAGLARLLLENGADPNYSEGCSLLYYALEEGQYDIAEALIEYGADVNSVLDNSGDSQSPLEVFIRDWCFCEYPSAEDYGEEAVFNALLKKGAVMPQESLEEIISQADTVEYNLSYIQRVVKQGDYSLPSPMKEIVSGDSDAALSYLNNVTEIDSDSKTALIIYASAFCNSRVIDRLIELGCDINTTAAGGEYIDTEQDSEFIKENDVNLLSVAARYNTAEAVKYLYEKGVKLNTGVYNLKYADYAAALNKNADTIRYIDEIAHGCTHYALLLACAYGNYEYTALYANNIEKLDRIEKRELLGCAAFSDSLDIIKLLTAAGADDFSEAADFIGTMSDETLNYLLNDCGSFKNHEEFLRYAIVSGDFERVKLIVESGADVNKSYANDFYDDEAPIFTAIYYGDIEIVDYLIEQGADIEKKDSRSRTPLMCAAQALSHNMVSLLLDKGSDPTAKDNNGETAADILQAEEITAEDEKMPKL
ncbi:MAG: ankyrin repeat domain-containing protein [Acutalibacteraceae bacterium]